MAPHQMLERIFGSLPKEGCTIMVGSPEPSGRVPFTVHDPSRRESDGSPCVHRCGVTPAVLADYGPQDVGGFG